ncbi:glycosyltransferase involved in cell wall biosynthesis [Aurantimicrobium minutum]|uniref:glycosyltransferase family 4 protein n=1 Tax=Aurantimicrobium minutum TaxID=708131 RepID=UPI002474E8A9|nr:glycosyltransferase family 4 protein [Aurantimicrobium minutum]MDH6425091.1 glycosyltransferase involved in cell wall biosynthesis [Aurantimicrobium minutum]
MYELSLAIIINSAYPRPGGVETHVKDKVSALNQSGVGIFQFSLAPKNNVGHVTEKNISITKFPMQFAFGSVMSFPPLGTTRKIISELKGQRISCVSTHTRFFPMTFVGYRVSRILGVPWVHSEHGSGFVRTQNPFIDFLAKIWDLSIGKFLLRKADFVVADSDFVAAFVERLSGVKAIVLENPIQIEKWYKPAAEHNGEIKSFVFAGRLVPGKGWDTFLDAVAEVSAANPLLSKIPVNVFGEGPDKEEVLRKADSLGLSSRICMHGNVSPETLRSFFQNSIYVNSSVLSEGFQITVLEAAASGSRVVSFDVPSAVSLKSEGVNIWVTQKGNYSDLNKLILDASYSDFTPPNKEQFNRWSWTDWVEKYLNIIEQIKSKK